MNELAQGLVIPSVGQISGPLPSGKFNSLADIISVLLTYLYPLAGFIVFVFIVLAGFRWLTSAGDAKKIEQAQKRLTYTIIGFVLLIVAYWVTKVVELILSPNNPFF